MTEKEFNELKTRYEKQQEQVAKAKARIDVGWEQISKEFGCTTFEQCEKKLTELRSKKAELQEKLEAAKNDYDKKWAGKV